MLGNNNSEPYFSIKAKLNNINTTHALTAPESETDKCYIIQYHIAIRTYIQT